MKREMTWEQSSAIVENLLAMDNKHVGDKPHGWIQCKGTDVCIDLHCKCGHHGHFDGEFFYYFECPKCKTQYAVGQNVFLHELTQQDQRDYASEQMKTCPLDEDE